MRRYIWSACLFELTGFSLFLAHVAQSVEHFLGKEEVIGSNPIVGSTQEMGRNPSCGREVGNLYEGYGDKEYR